MFTQKFLTAKVNLSRRQLLVRSGLFVTVMMVPHAMKTALAQPFTLNADAFHHLSKFLTDKASLDATISSRAYAALNKVDVNFSTKAAKLQNMIQENKFQNVDELKTAPGFIGEIAATAITIVSAWYLGYAGEGVALKSHDNTQFITYTYALMYAPVMDAEVIPTYAKWGLNFWEHPPKSIATD